VNWFALSFGAALTQAAQFAVVKGRARGIPPLVIVTWTQAIATASWAAFFLVTGHPFALPMFAWPAVAVCAVLVMGMSGLLARASAGGDISTVTPPPSCQPRLQLSQIVTATWYGVPVRSGAAAPSITIRAKVRRNLLSVSRSPCSRSRISRACRSSAKVSFSMSS